MNAGYYDRESYASYAQSYKETQIVAKGTPQEQELLRSLYKQASQLAGKEWNEFFSRNNR